ncbi:MAG: hypothetical protein C0498_13950, partial [Anaerolinea sp.]|nr:hypothetical protein [Anaerolinea sp.]
MPTGSTPRLAVIIAAAALLGACTGGDATPSATAAGSSSGAPELSPAPSPTAAAPASSPTVPPDPLEVYRAIAADVVEIRGLAAPERTDPQVIDAETLRKNLEAEFDESNPEAQIQIAERVYKALGLLPEGASLRDIYLELQGSQVIGYYDPSADELFIVSRSGSLGPTERLTYAHEFTHELQDRRFDLESLGLEGVTDEGDRGLAVLGLVEGDAVTVQGAWMTANLSPAELAQVAAEAGDPEMLAVLARTPAILLETSLFPYQAGATFIATLLARGGYAAVDAAYGNPPASTEQVIHPEKYLAGEAPIDVGLPTDLARRFGEGWTVDAQDTLGELQLRVWLREGGLAGDVARTAVEGWGGDRVALLAAPGGAGDGVVIVTEWDTAADAAEFRTAAE